MSKRLLLGIEAFRPMGFDVVLEGFVDSLHVPGNLDGEENNLNMNMHRRRASPELT